MKTQISERIIAMMTERIEQRNEKGYHTYLETLDDVPFENYDWEKMFIEEILDGVQYQQKRILQLEQELKGNQGMRLNEYQIMSKRTMPTPTTYFDSQIEDYSDKQKSNYAMGLAGESGEVVDYLKKVIHHEKEFDRDNFVKEVGDAMHYLSGLCTMYGVTLEEVATMNILKLNKRYPNGFNKKDSEKRRDEE